MTGELALVSNWQTCSESAAATPATSLEIPLAVKI